jgi:hypothetical protein
VEKSLAGVVMRSEDVLNTVLDSHVCLLEVDMVLIASVRLPEPQGELAFQENWPRVRTVRERQRLLLIVP